MNFWMLSNEKSCLISRKNSQQNCCKKNNIIDIVKLHPMLKNLDCEEHPDRSHKTS